MGKGSNLLRIKLVHTFKKATRASEFRLRFLVTDGFPYQDRMGVLNVYSIYFNFVY